MRKKNIQRNTQVNKIIYTNKQHKSQQYIDQLENCEITQAKKKIQFNSTEINNKVHTEQYTSQQDNTHKMTQDYIYIHTHTYHCCNKIVSQSILFIQPQRSIRECTQNSNTTM